MASFAKVWAIKTFVPANSGDVISVTLKNGKTKQVPVEAFLYQKETKAGPAYFYLPAVNQEEDA